MRSVQLSCLVLLASCSALALSSLACSQAVETAGEAEGRASTKAAAMRCGTASRIDESGLPVTRSLDGMRFYTLAVDYVHLNSMAPDGSDAKTLGVDAAAWKIDKIVGADTTHAYLKGKKITEGVAKDALYRLPLTGEPTPELLREADLIFSGSTALDADRLYWMEPSTGKTAGAKILSLPKAGGAKPATVTTIADASANPPWVLKLDAGKMYLAYVGAPAAQNLITVSLDGTQVQKLGTPKVSPRAVDPTYSDFMGASTMRFNETSVYYVGRDVTALGATPTTPPTTTGDEHLWTIAKADGKAKLLATLPADVHVTSSAVDGEDVYAITVANGVSTLVKITPAAPAAKGNAAAAPTVTPLVVATSESLPQVLVNGDDLVWTVWNKTDPAHRGIFKMPKADLAQNAEPVACAFVDAVTETPDAAPVEADAGTAAKPDSGSTETPDSGSTETPDSGSTETPDAGPGTGADGGSGEQADSGAVTPPPANGGDDAGSGYTRPDGGRKPAAAVPEYGAGETETEYPYQGDAGSSSGTLKVTMKEQSSGCSASGASSSHTASPAWSALGLAALVFGARRRKKA